MLNIKKKLCLEEKKETKKPRPKATPKKEKSPSRKKKESTDEEVEVFLDCEYLKGEFIAVRSEDSAFYLAECMNNIQEKDLEKPFKVFKSFNISYQKRKTR